MLMELTLRPGPADGQSPKSRESRPAWAVRPWGPRSRSDRLGVAAKAEVRHHPTPMEEHVMPSTVERSTSTQLEAWRDYAGDEWRERIDVAGFIRANVRPYTGPGDFLAGPTARTTDLW